MYHVVSRGVRQQAIYFDSRDRQRFLGLLTDVVDKYRWRCLTYCLMGNHYHLLVQLREPTLSAGMWRLNGYYAKTFARRHTITGHLFERRFWSKPVKRDAHLLALAGYIATNPVRANLCSSADDWPWSAHAALLGEAPPGFVDVKAALSFFDADPARARDLYAELATSNPQKGAWHP